MCCKKLILSKERTNLGSWKVIAKSLNGMLNENAWDPKSQTQLSTHTWTVLTHSLLLLR